MSGDERGDRRRSFAGSPLHAFRDSPPPSVDVEVEFGAASRKSALRTMNEDHYLIMRLGRNQETLMTSLPRHDVPQRFDEFGYAMVVADGVGGTGSGEAASRLALATLVHLVITFGRWNVRIDDDIAREVMARGERFYRGVDSTLLYKSHDSPPELQTTLTAAFSAGQDLFLAHVGHSRAYQVHNRELVRLTRDHTIAEAGRGGGSLLDIASAPRDSHHILTETIGGGDLAGPRIDIDQYRLEDGDRLLLCTNGLSDVVSEDRMADVLRSDRAAGDQCTALVDLALEAGGVDDVTALVAWYHIPKSDEISATGN